MEVKKESRRRNDSKRNSAVFLQEQADQSIQRRTSKKASSRDRQGQIYSDDFKKSLDIDELPDTPPIFRSATPLPISAFSTSRPASPQIQIPSRRGAIAQPRESTPQARSHIANHARNGSKESQSRSRTKTLEERFRDKSPTPWELKNRPRVGSLHTPTLQDGDQDPSSIGFPSIIPSPPLEPPSRKFRQKIAMPSSRPLSPIRNPIAMKPGTPLASSSTDAKKILQLMKTTCGRMHGILSFRTSMTGTWSSGYCAINVASGSLIYQAKGKVSDNKTLIHDLRGCQVRTLYDATSRSTYLDVATRRTSMGIHLRPHVPETFDSWLAALLCWQPIRPKGVQNRMTKPQEANIAERKLGDRKRHSGNFSAKDAAIIKVGKMSMWDKDARSGASSKLHTNQRISTYKQLKSMSKSWRKVSCTLQENGHFKLISEPDSTLMAIIPLSALSRCAIQRLDPSVLDDEFSIAIYPQYASTTTTLPVMQTVYLSLESRVLFEVWFVLLRAFTVPELYGPETSAAELPIEEKDAASGGLRSPSTDMFRVERLLSLRIIEAKLHTGCANTLQSSPSNPNVRPMSSKDMVAGTYYAEIHLDSEIRGKTAVKGDTSNPFWREDFEFSDLPPVLSSASIELKTRNAGQKDWTLAHAPVDLERGNINPGSIDGDIEVSPLDMTYGKLDIRIDEIERAIDTERWWPIINEQDELVGEMLMKIRIEELVVLMSRDYRPILELLHSFSNGLTNQIAQMAHAELKRISEILLNIFQVSSEASNWLMSLVEDEIDNIRKETPMSKFRYGRNRIASNDSYESGIEREVFLRDLGKNATVEANLLFRGNSLLTKALDLHMRRLGKEYLEDTLAEKMRDIDESDPECEVDPNKVKNSEDLQRNWRNLITLTENVWKSISGSAERCPPELRHIMRHIRACAEDRYGDFLRNIVYSSVSGFLFLRFFCPAVLNPKLFGLLKGNPFAHIRKLLFSGGFRLIILFPDHPRPRSHRTLTLITKTLQTLANLTTFGNKESWMEPMNAFLTSHRQEFKDFVDEICSISADHRTSIIPPSYATPITILSRLPGTSREGFPSLPYLVDQARECAGLIDVWLDVQNKIDPSNPMSDELKRFDELCEGSRGKSKECLTRAEQAERPSGTLEPKWEELVEQMERKARFRTANDFSSPPTPTTESARTDNSSTSSFADSYFHPRIPTKSSPGASRLVITSSPSSSKSPGDSDVLNEELDSETDTPPGSSSSIWDPGVLPPEDILPRSLSDYEEEVSTIPDDHTAIGSSIYSLTPTSKRTSTSTSSTIHPKPAPSKNSAYSQRHGGPRSTYSLRRSTERADISSIAPRGLGSREGARSSREGVKSRDGAMRHQQARSIYRLNTGVSSQHAIEAITTPRSPASRDGTGSKLRLADFGGVFRKKVKDREMEGGKRS